MTFEGGKPLKRDFCICCKVFRLGTKHFCLHHSSVNQLHKITSILHSMEVGFLVLIFNIILESKGC